MTNHDYGEGFYKSQYDLLIKAVRTRDLIIIALQKDCASMQRQIDDMAILENFVSASKQFFGLVLNPQKNQIKRG